MPASGAPSEALDRHIGEKQVMVDDDDVALGRPATHLGNEAALELIALLPCSLRSGHRARPQGTALGHRGKLGPVAGFGSLLPFRDQAEMPDLVQPGNAGCAVMS